MQLTPKTGQKLSRLEVITDSFLKVCKQTEFLVRSLSAEDQCVQAIAETSPTKWHLAHTAWFFETDAYARWAGCRFPTEAEWENTARICHLSGNFLENEAFHPLPAQETGLTQIYRDVWEWPASSYIPYPGFKNTHWCCGRI